MNKELLNKVEGILEGGILHTKDSCWIIIYKDRIVRTDSGKSSWKELRHAKSALIAYLRNYIRYPDYKQINIQYLIDNNIVQFKNLLLSE